MKRKVSKIKCKKEVTSDEETPDESVTESVKEESEICNVKEDELEQQKLKSADFETWETDYCVQNDETFCVYAPQTKQDGQSEDEQSEDGQSEDEQSENCQTVDSEDEEAESPEPVQAKTTPRKKTNKNATGSKTPWTKEEDDLIMKLMKKKLTSKLSYTRIAKSFPNRKGKQIRERWVNQLNPNINKSPWSLKEDEILLKYLLLYGKKWSKIATHLDRRTDNNVKNRYYCTYGRLVKTLEKDIRIKKKDTEYFIKQVFAMKDKQRCGLVSTRSPRKVPPKIADDSESSDDTSEASHEDMTHQNQPLNETQFVDMAEFNRENEDMWEHNTESPFTSVEQVDIKEEIELKDEELAPESIEIDDENTENNCDGDTSYGLQIASVSSIQSFDHAVPSTSKQNTSKSKLSHQVNKEIVKKLYPINKTKNLNSKTYFLVPIHDKFTKITPIYESNIVRIKRPYIKSVIGPMVLPTSPPDDDGGELITGIESDIIKHIIPEDSVSENSNHTESTQESGDHMHAK